MEQETKAFKCTQCNNIFLAAADNYKGSLYATPQPCPQCHSLHTLPFTYNPLTRIQYKSIYKQIWQEMDQEDRTTDAAETNKGTAASQDKDMA